MNRIDQLLQQMIAETSQQVLPTVYSATMLAGLQELQSLTGALAQQPAQAAPAVRALLHSDSVPDDFRNQASGYRAGWNDCLAAAPAAPVAPWPATWVSVADRLPGEDSEVIVSGWAYNDPARGRFVTHADFSDGQFKPVGAADEYDALHPPTHWMPMPAAPGEAPTPAAQQPDTVKAPRDLLERAVDRLTHGHELDKACRELLALLAGGAE